MGGQCSFYRINYTVRQIKSTQNNALSELYFILMTIRKSVKLIQLKLAPPKWNIYRKCC